MKLTYLNLKSRPRVTQSEKREGYTRVLNAFTGIGLKDFVLLITPFSTTWELRNQENLEEVGVFIFFRID